ncbi:MAG: hypothetical protein HYR48_02705 [Gemmatimonadetes bacterium]|nr:hypothetical protein [Gemmatimonadota bacterium]
MAALVLGAGRAARAQAQTTTYRATFSTAGQSMWGPGNAPSPIQPFTLTLFNETWANTGASSNIIDVAGFKFGGSIEAATYGDVGLKLEFGSPSAGVIGVNLPVDITLGLPAANSFRDGQTVTIATSLAIAPEAGIAVTPPGWDVVFTGRFGLGLAAGVTICVFGCPGFQLFPPVNNLPVEGELFVLGGGEFRLGEIASLLPHTITFLEGAPIGTTGLVDLPVARDFSNSVTASTLSATGNSKFMDLTIDMDAWLLRFFPLTAGVPLGVQTPDVGAAQLTYETIDLDALVGGVARQVLDFTPTVSVTLAFPRAVEYTVLDGTAVVEQGTSASITLKVGHTLSFVYPSGLKTPMSVVPSFTIANTVSNQMFLDFTEDVRFRVGIFALQVPSLTVIPGTSIPIPCGIFDFPPFDCSIDTPEVRSPAVTVGTVGPLFNKEADLGTQQYQMFDMTWELEGFDAVAAAPFTLDPEAPAIAVHAGFASGLATGGGPAGTLLHTVRLENLGDVQLGATQAADALAVASGTATIEVRGIRSRTLTVNTAFNGATDQNTLAGSDVLEAEDTGTVAILLTATPGTLYTTTVTGGGASPIGTAVNAGASAAFAVHPVEILPHRVQHHSQGVLTVHVLSAPGLDAADIHPGSVRLRGVEPLGWILENRNGHAVLSLRFDLRAVLSGGQSALAVAGASQVRPDVTAVAAAVLAQRARVPELSAADELGNRNGRLDVGDLRALLLRTVPPAPDGSGDQNAASPIQQSLGASGHVESLVLLGSWNNGTRFMAEGSITILGTGGRQ